MVLSIFNRKHSEISPPPVLPKEDYEVIQLEDSFPTLPLVTEYHYALINNARDGGKPLDALFAANAGLWICPCCETINGGSRCVSCQKPR